MRLTERDLNILTSMFSFGFLTTAQIAELFGMHLKVCQRRLRVLVKKDYLRKVLIPTINQGGLHNLFYPGKQAEAFFDIQASRPRLNWKTSHAIKNIDVMIQIALTCKRLNLECNLLPENIIRRSGQDVIPDGAFNLRKNGRSALFCLENDSGTEVLRSPSFNNDVENKILRYLELFEENNIGFYEQHFSQKFNRFRVLFIANNLNRLLGLSELLSEPECHFIWLSTLPKFNKEGICGNIWNVPANNEFNLSII